MRPSVPPRSCLDGRQDGAHRRPRPSREGAPDTWGKMLLKIGAYKLVPTKRDFVYCELHVQVADKKHIVCTALPACGAACALRGLVGLPAGVAAGAHPPEDPKAGEPQPALRVGVGGGGTHRSCGGTLAAPPRFMCVPGIWMRQPALCGSCPVALLTRYQPP